MNSQHVIQLINGFAIIVNEREFKRARRRFISLFNFNTFLTITDIHRHKITVPKAHILMFEHYNEDEIKIQKDN